MRFGLIPTASLARLVPTATLDRLPRPASGARPALTTSLPGLLALALCACLAACESDRAARCADFNEAMSDCFGDDFTPTDCRNVSDADLANITASLGPATCTAVREATPIDGDLESARCQALGEGCVDPVTPAPVWRPTSYPIILVNGIDVSPLFSYSDRIVSMMRGVGGHDVYLAIDTPYETPQVRAKDLWARVQQVRAQTGAAKVNLICHSLGGLDCRYLVSPGGLHWDVDASFEQIAGSVASITTVSTAHRGTRVADMALGLLPDGDADRAVESLATFLGDTFTEQALAGDVHLRASLQALTTSEALAFNAAVPDAPGIFYQSWGGYSRPWGLAPPGHDTLLATLCRADDGSSGLPGFSGAHDYMATTLIPSTDIVGQDPGAPDVTIPNDGLATVASARWGTFRGCIPADHMEQLGQRNIPDANVRTGFDVARFYTNLAADLAERGF